MIHFDILSAYILAIIALIATPGPVVALVIKNAISIQDSKTNKSMKNAFFTICGTNLGSLILIAVSIAVILGVAKVSESMLGIMSIVGSCFIFYLGFSSLYHTFKAKKAQTHSQTTKHNNLHENNHFNTNSKSKPYFLQGLLLSLSNPKDILFFIAFFPQFLGITHSIYLSITILTLSWIALDFSLLIFISYISQKIQLERFETLITKISDIVLIMVGIFGIVYGVISLMV